MKLLFPLLLLFSCFSCYAQSAFEASLKLGIAHSGSIEGENYTLHIQKVTASFLTYGIQSQLLDADFKDASITSFSVLGTFGLQSRIGNSNVFQGHIGIGPTFLNESHTLTNNTLFSITAGTRYIKELSTHFRLGLDVSLLINKEMGFSDVGIFLGYVF